MPLQRPSLALFARVGRSKLRLLPALTSPLYHASLEPPPRIPNQFCVFDASCAMPLPSIPAPTRASQPPSHTHNLRRQKPSRRALSPSLTSAFSLHYCSATFPAPYHGSTSGTPMLTSRLLPPSQPSPPHAHPSPNTAHHHLLQPPTRPHRLLTCELNKSQATSSKCASSATLLPYQYPTPKTLSPKPPQSSQPSRVCTHPFDAHHASGYPISPIPLLASCPVSATCCFESTPAPSAPLP